MRLCKGATQPYMSRIKHRMFSSAQNVLPVWACAASVAVFCQCGCQIAGASMQSDEGSTNTCPGHTRFGLNSMVRPMLAC
eukprot:1159491-Pelagomonas_calceolata.AAC.22